MRPRVLLVSPRYSYRIAAYVRAARSLDIQLYIASQGEYSLISEVSGGIQVDLEAPHAADFLVARARELGVGAVLATDDQTVPLASSVAERLGLRHNPPRSAGISRRKDLARQSLADAGLPVPAFVRIDLRAPLAPQVARVQYPCVVKPLAMSGSRGVIRANDEAELRQALQRSGHIVAQARGEEARWLLVEGFLPGREVALEGMLDAGQLTVLALFDKPDPLNGPFFEESYYISPSGLPEADQALIADRVQRACAAYGLREGPIHAELRLHDGDAWLLEMAARTIGGQCARLLQFGSGHGLEELVLAQAVGQPLSIQADSQAAGVLMIPIPRAGSLRRVEGLLAAQRVEHVEDVEIYVREGYELVPLPEGSSYLGFIFARGPDPECVEQALRQAHAELNFVVAPSWPIQAGGL